ncbi:MAG TPA: hypothetical protein PLX39_15470 [Pyrinomonadaceae bacterium]|nr:hypothetical protein [Pyrinomonadaceae bacterium]
MTWKKWAKKRAWPAIGEIVFEIIRVIFAFALASLLWYAVYTALNSD